MLINKTANILSYYILNHNKTSFFSLLCVMNYQNYNIYKKIT
eukprot:UN17487